MSKERPIIFSAPMVRAILEGRKSMTRRIVKPQPNVIHAIHPDASITTNLIFSKGDQRIHCPYGVPGDRLWVRETWDFLPDGQNSANIFYWVDGDFQQRIPPPEYNPFLYNNPRKRPSIHMPRWASRITLEIVSVRVERVKEISEEDADKEGFGGDFPHRIFPELFNPDCGHLSMQECFAALWESIHGPCSWEQNPWVWVIEFGRIA